MAKRRKTPYGYTVWPTGRTFAAHVYGPGEWMRQHGFATGKEAEWWCMDMIVEMGERAPAKVDIQP